MKFQNNNDFIVVNIDNRQIIFKQMVYDMIKIDFLSDTQSKFTFDNHSVKINNGRLSLYDVEGTLINTYLQVDNNLDTTKDLWDKYIIYKNNYLYVDKKRTRIIVNNQEYPIVSSAKIGTTNVYNTEVGTLSLSGNINRPSTWNGITIEIILI